MPAYRAVLFDLFDTLVLFNRERLPVLQINGQMVHTTAGYLHPVLHERYPHVSLEDFYHALVASWQEAERRRSLDHREVSASERMAILFERLEVNPAEVPRDLVDRMLSVHAQHLSEAALLPPEHLSLVRTLKGRYRLAVVSNFDYTPTAHRVLERAGLLSFFEAVVISDRVGWRKPSPIIFHEALNRLSLDPADALFVGDRPEIDVLGAKRVGMDVAWVNPGAEPLPGGIPQPDYQVGALPELLSLL
ncbi:MAG: HAD family hydrolase [Candidatus Rokubacteria bacterium]|nr:HAD family hydrolase [Candidatus Rokubacteria bacterium]